MASSLPPILVEIQADVASLKKGLADAQNTLKGLDDSVNKSGTAMTGFMDKLKNVGATLGVAFAGTQVISFFRESIAAANEASNAQERLATLLRNTNGGTKAQIQALYEQAEALEAVGVVSKDNIIVAQSQLATFDLQASTINKLTPAILDYVTAEKGAAASADDYKQMTNSLAQALNGNFTSLTKVGFVLDETTKKQISSGTESERAAAIVEVLNSTYKGFNETLRDNNPLQAAINDLDKLKGDIGEALLPIIDELSRFISNVLIPGFRSLAKFVKDNSDAIKTFAGVLAAGYAAMKLYRGMIILTTTAKNLLGIATTLLRGKQLATIASTNGMAASMLALNAVMRANPIGVVVTVLALLAAAVVTAWKKSETFRTVVISVAKAALNAFASIIPMLSKVYEAIAKVVTGPLRLFLTVLSKLPGVGKLAKSGLDTINKGLDGISDLGDKAAKKAKELSAQLDKMGKTAKEAGKKVKEATDPFAGGGKGGGKGKTLTDKEKEKLQGYYDKVEEIYADINEVMEEANTKAAEALIRRNEQMTEAQERYNERRIDLQDRFNEQLADAQERHDEKVADLNERYREKELEAQARAAEETAKATKRYGEEVIKINKDYDKKKLELETSLQDKLADLRKNAADKSTDLTRKAAEKQAGIIEQSIDRLRNAFASKTGFNLTEAFGKGASGQEILGKLTEKLRISRNLAEKAEFLAANGFTQPFIEQVIAAGPEIGNELADAILQATPETIEEFKKTFNELEKVSQTGLDALAVSMNAGANLATQELRDAYAQVSVDLKASLNEVDRELTENMAEQQRTFDAAMTETKKVRDEKLAEALTDMLEATAEAQKQLLEAQTKAKSELDKGLADATAELMKSRVKAQEELSKGLADAQNTLQKALINAQKDYEKAIDEINVATQKKLNELVTKLNSVLALIAKIQAANAAAAAASAAGSSAGSSAAGQARTETVIQSVSSSRCASGKGYFLISYDYFGARGSAQFVGCVLPTATIPTFPTGTPPTGTPATGTPNAGTSTGNNTSNNGTTINNDITINQNTQSDPISTANSIVYAIKYGTTVQVAAGTVTTGVYAEEGVSYFE